MYFTKVELHNFGIYKGTHEMCLRNQEGGRNITLVGGLNGRGKTTFHDAILLALYGKQALTYIQEKARSFERFLLEHINKAAADGLAYVAVTINLEDGTILRVKRSWQAKGSKINHQIEVEKNGIIDKYLGESWSYYVEEILPFGIARFFFFNNEKITQLADDTSFEQIKASIRSAIGVSAIEKTIEHIDEVIRRKRQALDTFERSETTQEFRLVEEQLSMIEARLEEARRRVNELERKNQEASVELDIKEQEFWASGGDLGRNRDHIKAEMQRINQEVEKVAAAIMQLIVDPATPLSLCRGLVVRSYEAEQARQLSGAQYYTGLQAADLKKRILSRLAECGIDPAVFSLIERILAEECSPQDSDAASPSRVSMSHTSMMLYQRLIAETFDTAAHRIMALVSSIDRQESELLNLDAHLGAADDKTMAMQLFEVLKEYEKAKNVIDIELQRQLEYIESLQRQRGLLVNKRIQLLRALAERENANDDDTRTIKYAAMAMEVLAEFQKRLQQAKVAQLSATTTHCFASLVGKNSLVQEIHIDPATLDISIIDAHGNELLKSQLSAGEQQMFAISVVWALALCSGYQAPVIIDTPMARLDSAHRTNFLTKYLPAASSQVMVLSTDEEVHGRYHDLIRDKVLDYYTLLYQEDDQCTTIVPGYFKEA